MTMEAYWSERRERFMANLAEDISDQELLAQYRNLLEEMKSRAMSDYPHDDALRQAVALLFHEAMQGAELLPARGMPTVVFPREDRNIPALPRAMAIALHPYVRIGLLALAFVLALFSGFRAMGCGVAIALAAALEWLSLRRSAPKATAVPTAVSSLRLDYLDTFITRQAKQLDQHIDDMKKLFEDASAPADLTADAATLSLCQNVWAVANAGYPPEAALYNAEKLLRQMDADWLEYTHGQRNAFEVMPTRKESRTVYPAVRRAGDGMILCRGQYIEHKD